jgi:hypothetical protein
MDQDKTDQERREEDHDDVVSPDKPLGEQRNRETIKGFDTPVTTPAERQRDAKRITM